MRQISYTLPFDLTFVDADDTMRYFTPGKERIFDRSRAILGRKVQYCHPPKSVHVVNQIVRDFKAGKQERAQFWINMGGRLIYICNWKSASSRSRPPSRTCAIPSCAARPGWRSCRPAPPRPLCRPAHGR